MNIFNRRLNTQAAENKKRDAMPAKIEIRMARRQDIGEIYRLSQELAIERMDEAAMEKGGFLVSGYSEAEYEALLDSHEYFYVLLLEGEIAGFVIAQSSDAMEDGLVYRLIRTLDDGPFVYIQQVCIGLMYQHMGYGQALYQRLLDGETAPAYACVVEGEKLTNVRSISFHEKMGFTKAFQYTPDDGHRRAIYRREPPKPTVPALLTYSMVRTGAVAGAALLLSLVIAISSSDYRILGMSVVVVIYFSLICFTRLIKYRAGDLRYLVAECIGAEKLRRGQVEYYMRICDSWQAGSAFYLVFPKKRRLREGERYEILYDLGLNETVSEKNLIAYRAIAAKPGRSRPEAE